MKFEEVQIGSDLFSRYIAENSPLIGTTNPDLAPLFERVDRMYNSKAEWSSIALDLAAARRQHPGSGELAVCHIFALVNAEEFETAEQSAAEILNAEMIGPATKRLVFFEQIRAIAKRGDLERVQEICNGSLQTMPVVEQVELLDFVSCLPITDGVREFLPQAYELSKKALKLSPQIPTLHGTYAALLCEQGLFDEAARVLESLYRYSPRAIDRGIAAFYLALHEKRRSNLKCARTLAWDAEVACPEGWLIRRVRDEFGAAV